MVVRQELLYQWDLSGAGDEACGIEVVLRREGLYAGLYSFIEKLAFATAPLTLGILMSQMGFVRGLPRSAVQPDSALLAITIAIAIIPAIVNVLKIVLALNLKLDLPASRR